MVLLFFFSETGQDWLLKNKFLLITDIFNILYYYMGTPKT